ncbi:MAG TPA: phosphate ABC transporter substrate-binding protein PstS [Bryobacteraceae bacterium]|jgi:phosphate transport system substrate-binding protein|nr:phosphate ABC transporter substrate-binding protein PstS [Bryobacteraceae bacterium]
MQAQSADSLRSVRRIYVGSMGPYSGGDELRRDLIRYLKKSKEFELAMAPDQCDAILEGRGELWTRGYHSLSPRARKNSDSAEPVYGGYLSVRLRGKDGEILWSYFADPRRITIHELPRDLVDEVVTRLKQEHNEETAPATAVQNANDAPATLRGGGATFPFPIYQDWFTSFHARHPAWTLTYAGTGSENGITQLASGGLDFAGSDVAPAALPESVQTNSDFFPTVAGAVVLIYNLPGFNGELHLTADVIAGIFSGAIRAWNDPKLVALNPSAPLSDLPIQVFHRSDGSGTTYALTDYLSRVNSAWGKSIGAKAVVQWATGKGGQGNESVAADVAATPYSLGYTEFIYAFNHHLNFAAVRNQTGRFVLPDLLSIMAAANWAGDRTEDLNLSIVNSPETSAYPISTMTWIVLPRNLPADKRAVMATFLEWMLTSGQRQCSGLGYAPLPRNVLDRELSAVKKLR